jgi:hypothetical protein
VLKDGREISGLANGPSVRALEATLAQATRSLAA